MMKFSKLFLLFLIFTIPVMAKIKIVERSTKKVPVWVNTTQKDYIITSAIAGDIERAKNECLDNIRKYIIDAVAQNVKSSSESTINQETVNSGITKFLDTYHYSAQTQSANVPYLTGISASKIEESYWEKREDKDKKEISFLYCVKYPFPSVELKKLVHEFRTRDNEMNDKLKKLETGYDNIESAEQIGKAITDLNTLISYFFDDIRKEIARNLQNGYQQLYKQIHFREISNLLGTYEFTLALNGKDISVSQRPTLKSETLAQLRAEQTDHIWKVYYNAETCDPSEENSAIISFRLGGHPLTQQFYVDLNQNKVQLMPTKEIHLSGTLEDSELSNISARINIDSKAPKKITIKSITLDIPGLDQPLLAENQEVIIEGTGIQILRISFGGTAKLLAPQNYKSNLLKGYFEVVDEQNSTHRIDFSLPFKANW